MGAFNLPTYQTWGNRPGAPTWFNSASGGGSGSSWSQAAPFDEPYAMYTFDEGSGNVVNDKSPQGLHLTINSSGNANTVWNGSGDDLGLDLNTPPGRPVTAANVNTTDGWFTLSSKTEITNGQRGYWREGTTAATGMTDDGLYYWSHEGGSSVRYRAHTSQADAEAGINWVVPSTQGSGSHTIDWYNPDNYWYCATNPAFIFDEMTIYAWITMNNAKDIFDLISISDGSPGGYRFKLGVGHNKQMEPRVVAGPDYWLNPVGYLMGHNHPSTANLGTEYHKKHAVVYRNGTSKAYVAYQDGQDYLLAYHIKVYGAPSYLADIKRGFARVGDSNGFASPNGEDVSVWDETYTMRQRLRNIVGLGGALPYNSNMTLRSCTGPVSEQSDVTFKKLMVYNGLKSAAHDKAVWDAGKAKTTYWAA